MNRILFFLFVALMSFFSGVQLSYAQENHLEDIDLLMIAKQYRLGIIREVNPTKAVEIYKYLAHKGNSDAMNELGKCYLNGDGIDKNNNIAFNIFKKAANLGNTKAKCNLALMYQKGLNGKANLHKAYMLYKEAADSGFIQGLYGVGYLLYKGMGVEQNYSEAIKYLKKGSEKGHSGCSMLLASYYANGYDGIQNLSKAEEYWRKASRDGNSWTVDVTKNNLVDSITKRIGRRSSWKHLKSNILDSQEMPKITNNVYNKELVGIWKGTIYCYDWSKKNILDEKNIKLNIEERDDSIHIEYYMNDSLQTSYSTIFENGKFISRKLTEEQKMYPWTVTQTLFEKHKNKLFVDIKVLNLKNMSIQKPMLAILEKDSITNDTQTRQTFYINKISYKNNNIEIDITTKENINVDITIHTANGILKKQKNNNELEVGRNKIIIPAFLKKADLAGIVTISHKGERHSKNITVESNE